MATPVPMRADKAIEDHIAVGPGKVAVALRHQAWEGGAARNLTLTQGDSGVLDGAWGQRMRLNDVAAEICLTAATASDAVGASERKGLVRKARAADDRRSVALTLTAAGRQEAGRTGAWSDLVRMGVACLSTAEQTVLLRGLIKIIQALQEQGVISTVRMCAGCSYFHPYAHAKAPKPHHGTFVNKAMGEGQLRLECPDFVPVPEGDASNGGQCFQRQQGPVRPAYSPHRRAVCSSG
ncbi:MarR family winged helix-turn-helix transcriptional regulator [Nitrospira sp. NS4]|uniref:MarR family winged helix-turn-helix transcriptional regulator n=1 Tax=Nitrospira sp. NS4 TaxID=3414498 RepID=UPI003C30C199